MHTNIDSSNIQSLYVFKAIVLNKIMYALPVYFGYLTMLQRVLHQQRLHPLLL